MRRDPGTRRSTRTLDDVTDGAGPDVRALAADDRPVDETPVHTEDLPATPVRDRNIPATAWVEAPEELLTLGDDIGQLLTTYKRRIGPWLLWRAGPARRADARYLAVRADDLAVQHAFRLLPDGTGHGIGPSGERHTRFRTWKEDLLHHRPDVDDDGPTGA
jgi:hypothetical protein